MKSGGPWNLRGLRPEARAAARDAARRSGLSVGEWLNSVIQSDDEESWSEDFDRETRDRSERRPHRDERDDARYRGSAPVRRREYELDEPRRRDFYDEDDDGRSAPRHAPSSRRARESYDDDRRSFRDDERGNDMRGRDDDMRREVYRHRRASEPEDRWERSFDERRPDVDERPEAPRRRRERETEEQPRLDFRGDERQPRREAPWRRRGHDRDEDDAPPRPQRAPSREQQRHGSPYRDESERDGGQRRQRERAEPKIESRIESKITHPAEDARDAAVDKAVAEIAARQRVLEGNLTDEIAARQRALSGEPAASLPQSEQPQPPPPAPEPATISELPKAAEPSKAPEPRKVSEPPTASEPGRLYATWAESQHAQPPVDLRNLEQQLRDMTARIEMLRPSRELETAIDELRTDLAEIGQSITQALPRRALESLEIEVKALGQRIDHSRQAGVDATALSGLERGLTEVRDALRGLTPAESLVGFEDAVKGLSKKIDAIVSKDDPAALQQLETAIGALRGIVSHVASNDTLTKVAEDVRALSAKVDTLAGSTSASPTLVALENRIDVLASALNASTEAGHAVPRELEKLLSGLIEKLEWVQLTHTDHTALAHLEDRIAALVKRLDASDARLGMLEGVERGLADLLVYIKQLRGDESGAVAAAPSSAIAPVVPELMAIMPIERRAQTPAEDAAGALEQSSRDRTAALESDLRGRGSRFAVAAKAEPVAVDAPATVPEPVDAEMPASAATMSEVSEKSVPFDPVLGRAAPSRTPLVPNLPPDHPLEPGFAPGRSRQSPAERIAASEAVAGSKPPVIPDPGAGKPDFIAAARRAAQVAAAATPDDRKLPRPTADGVASPKKSSERLRTIVVALAVVAIIVGGFHIVSRLLDDGPNAPAPVTHEPRAQATPQVQTEPLPAQPEPQSGQPEAPRVEPAPPHADAGPPSSLPAAAGPPTALDPGSGAAAKPDAPASTGVPGRTSDSAPVSGASAAIVANAQEATPTDITGSVASPQSSATGGELLPLTIGGPALRLAALAGDPLAAYEVAVRFAEGRGVAANNAEAARWFDVAAKKGIAPAQFRLATLYEKGLGVAKNLATARDLYRAAADKGHGKAMHNLAVLYAEGIDGKPDYHAAAQWFRKAADHGVADSEYNLAILYARGVGVDQNFTESYKWFFLAAKDGDQDAAQKRDEIAKRLDEKSLAAARAAAERWTPVPQPADAIAVKGAWDAPAASSAAKPKSKSLKTSATEATKSSVQIPARIPAQIN